MAAFASAEDPRERLAPARRFLAVTKERCLEPDLAVRLLPLLRTPADLRFLMDRVPTAALADQILNQTNDADLRSELVLIRRKRRFP